jgi:hypothetical protein
VKSVPPKMLALGLVCLLLTLAVLLLSEDRTLQAEARALAVTSSSQWLEDGEIELIVRWQWAPQQVGSSLGRREELLAVSFDTKSLVWLGEEAPLGRGARGEALRRLDLAAGPDGARRLFSLPVGQDGYVRLRFLPNMDQSHTIARLFRVYVVPESAAAEVWMAETDLPDAISQVAVIRQDF